MVLYSIAMFSIKSKLILNLIVFKAEMFTPSNWNDFLIPVIFVIIII